MTRRIRVTPVGKDGIEVTTQPGTKIEVKPVVESGNTLGLADTDPLPPAVDADPGTSDLASRADHVHPEQEVGAGTLAELEDVDLVTDPPEHDDVLAWDEVEQKWTPATLSATGGGGGGGAVDSVDGRTGDVTLADLYEAAGAVSALEGTLGSAALEDSSAFATAAQGTLAGTAVQPGALVAYQLVAGKDAANGYAGLSALGKLSTSVLPALSITETTVVASQAAMLALTAQQGDVAVRSDIKATFILAAADPSVLGNWVQLPTPTDAVLSVNGATGVVVLGYSDVGAASAAQGALADTAVQPGDLGTAAYSAATDFATSAQGGKADTALQPGTLGSAAYENSTAFATAAQGGKADSAVQPGSLGSAAYQSSTAFAASSHGHSSGEVSGLGDAATKDVGTTTGTVAAGDDARLSDARTPTSHNHAASEVTSGTLDIARIPTGTTSTTVPLGNDSRFADARTPTAHKTSHATGGSDALTASDIGAAATSHTHTGTQVTVDASGFNGNLTTTDDTVQEIAQKFDDLSIPAAGIADPGGSNDDFLQRKAGAWANRTVAQVKTDLGVGTHRYYIDNEWYLLSHNDDRLGGGSGYTPGTNAMAFWLVVVEQAIQVDGCWFYLQATGTSAKMRVGIWDASATTGKPTGNPLVSSAEVDVSASTGYKSQTFTPVTLQPGTYWGGIACVGTATYRTWNAASGVPPIDMGSPDSAVTVNWSWNSPWTYSSSALPDVSGFTYTAQAGTTVPSTAAPYVRWRVQIP